MNKITIPVPTLEQIKATGGKRFDGKDLQTYYGITRCRLLNNDNSDNYRISAANRRKYEEGFKEWLNANFIKTPSWLKQFFRIDSYYKPIYNDSKGRYYEFDESELANGTSRIEGLKNNLASIGQTLVKVSDKKWRVYLKGSSASSSKINKALSNTRSTTSSDSITSTSNTSSAKSVSPITGSTTDTSSTVSTDSTTNTDSTTRSFDFLDDVLGTQKEASKDKTTELDPNQIANTIVSETKLNDTAISSLVATYLNSLHRINRSYNTQTK